MSLDRWRRELDAWLDANAPKSLYQSVSTPFQGHWGGTRVGFASEDLRIWFECCLARGYTAPTWPKAYGGAEMPVDHARVWSEALIARGLPLPLVGFGLAMIGPIVLEEGSDALKARHLPPIVRGEVRWCQGYSEPAAGSDLAALATSAVRDGDEFVVNGQKIWTSHADVADWIFCLVRTDSSGAKQAGITFLLIDMDDPGITTRSIQLISGASPFCEVFFEDVRVPVGNVVGDVDGGWRVAKALLRHERGVVGESVAAGGARPDILQGYTVREDAVSRVGLRGGVLADPVLRDDIIRFEMDERALRLTLRRARDRAQAGGRPGPESSLAKLVGTELNQERWKLALRVAGADGLGWQGEGYDAVDQALVRQWLRARGNTIEGGTSEVQRNIVARRVLGLPKGGA